MEQPKYGFFDSLTRMVLIGLVFLLPFWILPVASATIAQGKMLVITVVAILALLSWLCARTLERVITLPRSMLIPAVLLIPLAYIASLVATGWNNGAFVGTGVEQDTLGVIAVLCALFFTTAVVYTRSFFFAATRALLAGVGVLFAYQLSYLLYPSLGFGLLVGDTANVLGSWHDLGILAGLSLFVSVIVALRADGLHRYGAIVLAVLSAAILTVVHFLDVFLALGVIAVLGGVFFALRDWNRTAPLYSIVTALTLFIMGIVSLGAFSVGPSIWERLPEQIRVVQTEVRPSWQGTWDVARQSLQGTELIFGSGPNSFTREWGKNKPASVNLTPFWDVSFNYGVGIIPTSIVALGVVGLSAWVIVIFCILLILFRLLRDRENGMPVGEVLLLITVYLVGYHIAYTPGTALTALTFLSLGLLAGYTARGRIEYAMSLAAPRGAVVLASSTVVVALFIAAGIFLEREIVSNLFVNRAAYILNTTNDLPRARLNVGYALRISTHNDRAHRAAAELGMLELARLMAESKGESQEDIARLQASLQETIGHGLRAVALESSRYENWLLLASLYSNLAGVNVEGALQQAVAAYQKAFETQPSNPTPAFRLAQLASAAGDAASARALLGESVRLKPDFSAAYFLLSQIEAAAGKGDEAVAAALQAAQLAPEDPVAWFNVGYILYLGGAYRDSALAFQRVVALVPDHSNALFYLGLSYDKLDMSNDAVAAFTRVAELNPDATWIRAVIANVQSNKDPLADLR